jgi:YD repeat-containing protein
MALSGATGTGLDGSATYRVPLEVPPGATGIQPVLRLEYSSAEPGAGYLSPGWNLFGEPVVRCANAPEKFCAADQPLVAAKGAYGADGTEYRAAEDKFERFISHGGHDGQPDWIESTTKTGEQISEYGNGPNAQQRDPKTGKVTAWFITQGRNPMGNYVRYSYDRDEAIGKVYPARIDYTGNARTKLAPFDSVQFSYDAVDGAKKLTHIKTYAGDRLVRDYRLEYARTPDFDQQLLSKISLCDTQGDCLMPIGIKWQVFHPKAGKRALPLVGEADNGLGFVDWFTYKAPPALPAKASAALKAVYPAQIVATIAYTDAAGSQSHNNYTFSGTPMLLRDGAFGGFAKRQVTDQEEGVVRTSVRSTEPNTQGAIIATSIAIGPVETNAINYTFGYRPTVKGAGFAFLTQSVTHNKDMEGHPLLAETERETLDEFGNATTIVRTRDDGWSRTTSQKFSNDTGHWFIGRMLSSEIVTKNAHGEIRRTAAFQYDPQTGILAQDIIEPDAPQSRLVRDYGYDELGHRVRETVSGPDIQTRTAAAIFDDKGLFDIRQKVSRDPANGQALTTADGGSITRDSFGRIIAQVSPKEKITLRYAYCKSIKSDGEDCPPLAATLVEGQYSLPTPVKVTSYFSGGGLFVGSLSVGTGRPVLQERSYDRRRHMVRNCAQIPGNEKPACESFHYDVSGRLLSATDAQGHQRSYEYDGLTTKMTDASGVTITTVSDSDGKPLKISRDDASTSYVRDPMGFDTEAQASDGRWVRKSYDMRGNLVKFTSGSGAKQETSVERKFNVLNELVSVTDAGGNTQGFPTDPARITPLAPNTEYVPPQAAKP